MTLSPSVCSRCHRSRSQRMTPSTFSSFSICWEARRVIDHPQHPFRIDEDVSRVTVIIEQQRIEQTNSY